MSAAQPDGVVGPGLLDDPAYQPAHPPVNGSIPWVVARWGPRSQVRWFRRFGQGVSWQPDGFWTQFYVSSTLHTGRCCPRCEGVDWDDPADYWEGPGCCCLGPLP